MIIRGLHVEHWRCIGKLDLDDLGAGIVVFHGPNKTGKSSLVRAIRCCLFDLDHDHTGNKLKDNIPWNGQGPPKVSIEFETGGAEYRITKVFSRRVDGLALLEKKVGTQWQVDENSPKEASRKTREMLNADKSTEGLNQLLWLDQGVIDLPESERLDASLEKALVSVLGVMVTGSDFTFKQELDERCAKWFTEGGKYRQNSRVTLLERQMQECTRLRDQEKQKFTELEKTIQTMEVCLDELPSLRRLVQDAQEELQRLEEERNRSLERRTRYTRADEALQRAQQELERTEQALRVFHEAQRRCGESEEEVQRLRNVVEEAKRANDQSARQHTTKQQAVIRARNAEDAHQELGGDIDDRRQVVVSFQKQSQLQESLAAIRILEQEIQKLEEKIKKTLAPDDTGLEQLRGNRRKAQELRALLGAEEFTINVSIQRPTRISLTLENNQKQPLELLAGEKKSWSVRQRAEMEIGDLGKIELTRSHENLDLERSARQLSNLDRNFNDAIRTYEEDPLDQASLDRLSERKILRESWQASLSNLRNELATKAPKGRGVLESECAQLETLRQAILQRRPELAQWVPQESEVEDLSRAHGQQATTLRQTRVQLEAEEEQAQKDLQEAGKRLQRHEKELASAIATAKASQQELLRLGEENMLLNEMENARTKKREAEINLVNSSLNEHEKTIEQRYENAKTALQQRQERLRQMEIQLSQLSGVLRGNEGLHAHLANAEAAVQEAELALAREKLEAEAHRRLSDLFESCRESRVQRVIGPVAGRVLEWARQIGLNDYHEVRFGDKFLPEGIVRQSTSPQNAIAIENEGYGTSEQLSLLVRLALGGILAKSEPAVAILDDPLAHTDPAKHRKVLDILRIAAEGNKAWNPPAGPLQIIILTCHPDRFDYLPGARHYDLARLICR